MTWPNKTDAGNGSKAICRVSNVLRSPSPDPRRSPNRMEYHPSQVSRVGWYIASYIERIDPLTAYESGDSSHEPWAVWENRILVKAHTPHEALERTKSHLEKVGRDYENADGVMVRASVAGLTGLIPIYDPLDDGEEIEWFDHTGETVADMLSRIVVEEQLEAFTIPENGETTEPT